VALPTHQEGERRQGEVEERKKDSLLQFMQVKGEEVVKLRND